MRLRGRTRITTSIFLSVVPPPPASADDDDDVWRRIDRGVRPRRGDGDGGSLARVARCRRESEDSELLRCCCAKDLGFGVASRGGLADDERVGVRGGTAARRRGVRGGGGSIDIFPLSTVVESTSFDVQPILLNMTGACTMAVMRQAK